MLLIRTRSVIATGNTIVIKPFEESDNRNLIITRTYHGLLSPSTCVHTGIHVVLVL